MRHDAFDRLRLRLQVGGMNEAAARGIAETCRESADLLALSQVEREDVALHLAQIQASGRLHPEELRAVKDRIPFLYVEANPFSVAIPAAVQFAIRDSIGYQKRKWREGVSDLVRAVAEAFRVGGGK